MKSKSGIVILAAMLSVGTGLIAVSASGQFAPPFQIQRGRRAPQRGSRQNPPALYVEASKLPTATSHAIIWVQCPADATSLYPRVTCGYLPVPLHREQPQKTEKIRIYFEVYPHTNAGQAVSAILVNGGGPGLLDRSLPGIVAGDVCPQPGRTRSSAAG
jgi:hypothetical protein